MNRRQGLGILVAAAVSLSAPVGAYADELTAEYGLIPHPKEITVLGQGRVAPYNPEPAVSYDALPAWRPEQYALSITPEGIAITAADRRGEIWALRTLDQLRDSAGTYPQLRITDYPEFPVRGFMYDDGRNFVGVERVKRFIDVMSEYKLNVFQWHLTDKPAWRIESRCHPRLNDGKFQRPGRDQGAYYTYAQIRDVIAYAGERGITVIPEIDMPGHSDFFKTAFGFPMDSPEGMEVLEECLAEFFEEIPAEMCPYIHIGSDEVKIADPEGFMKWAQDIVRRDGRKTLSWDPGLAVDSLTIRQFWRDGDPGKIAYPAGVPFVDSGMGYLNYYDPLLMPAKLYFHTPCGTGESGPDALGGILCLWNDVRVGDKDLVGRHSGMLGGIMTFAERFWNGGTVTDEWLGTVMPGPDSCAMALFERFQERMAAHKQRRNDGEMDYWEPVHATPWEVEISSGSDSVRFTAYGDVLDLDALCASRGIPADIPADCRVTRVIKSERDTVIRYKIGFDAPARSNRVSDGIPARGNWPNFGTVAVNGVPVSPGEWDEPETYRYHYNTWAKPEEELPYTNEQLYWMREPVEVPLAKGDNLVELRLRRHFKGQRFQVGFVEVR